MGNKENKVKINRLICLSITIGLIFISLCLEAENKGTLLGGAAEINITPSRPVRMSGYGESKVFTGVHDSLYASALVFDDGKTRAAIITADLIGFSHKFYSETTTLIEQSTGISKENILMSAAHVHGGPVTRTYEKELSDNESEYIRGLQQKLVKVIKEASENMQPIMIGSATGSCNMNINRRAKIKEDYIWLGKNPDGPCDHDVFVVRVESLDHKLIAIFVNWPCHATAAGHANTYITGDWPGATARYIRRVLGNDVVVPVTAGASGNINPIYRDRSGLDHIDAMGILLGKEVIDIAGQVKTTTECTVNVIGRTIIAKGKEGRTEKSKDPKELVPSTDVEINLSVLKVGNIVFAGISGELFTEIGKYIKTESPGVTTVVITHCNGSSGYLCTDEAYPQGGYEVAVSRTMPGTEQLIKKNIMEMIKSVQ